MFDGITDRRTKIRNLTEQIEMDHSGQVEPNAPLPSTDDVYRLAAVAVIKLVPQFISFKETTIQKLQDLNKVLIFYKNKFSFLIN